MEERELKHLDEGPILGLLEEELPLEDWGTADPLFVDTLGLPELSSSVQAHTTLASVTDQQATTNFIPDFYPPGNWDAVSVATTTADTSHMVRRSPSCMCIGPIFQQIRDVGFFESHCPWVLRPPPFFSPKHHITYLFTLLPISHHIASKLARYRAIKQGKGQTWPPASALQKT